jgi:phosphatidylserine/phosphatidylglycerophosphate/cardiolipin synthase-like enzyme
MNVALRAVYDSLRGGGDPAVRWRTFAAALSSQALSHGNIGAQQLRAAGRSVALRIQAGEWLMNLRLLDVLDSDGKLNLARADAVGTALELVANSFEAMGVASFWAPVATLPARLHPLLHPPAMRQTAGVLLELVDRARKKIWLAAPFIDPYGVGFMTNALCAAGIRGVDISVVTSAGQGLLFVDLAGQWRAQSTGSLHVSEVHTDLSPLGSHAKLLVIDDERAYVGSANLTAAGLGRHIELGVELAGTQVVELSAVLVILQRIGVDCVAACVDARPRS